MGQKAIIISGFPGVGKTTLFTSRSDIVLLDSDSTNFSWKDVVNQVRHSEWPANYIAHIQKNMNKADAIFVSSHQEVRDALTTNNIEFVLVYPGLDMKKEYIRRYRDRGNNKHFMKLLETNYTAWIQELIKQQNCIHIMLQPGQYLSDVFPQIMEA